MLTGIFENGKSVVQGERTANSIEVHQTRTGAFEIRRVERLAVFASIEEANAEAALLSAVERRELDGLRELREAAGMNCEGLPAEVREALHKVPEIEKTHGHREAIVAADSSLGRYLESVFDVTDGAE